MMRAILMAVFTAMTLSHSSAFTLSTIDATNRFSYGANLGWMDWRGDVVNGAVIGEYICTGYIYSANVGWINLGSGTPANGTQYKNNSATDYGVNHDGLGNLRGFAYGANIGWINFENIGAPKVDLFTGKLSGYAWSANCGWISLGNATAYVQTDTIQQGALAPNGLPAAWLMSNFGTTNVNADADADGDGVSNANEYLAGTGPTDPNSLLRITLITHSLYAPDYTTLDWNAVPTRFYAIEKRSDLVSGSWADLAVFPFAGANNAGFNDSTTNQFYRIRAFRPLMP